MHMNTTPAYKTEVLLIATYVHLFYMTVKQLNGLYNASKLILGWFLRHVAINVRDTLTNDTNYSEYKNCGVCLTNHIGWISDH